MWLLVCAFSSLLVNHRVLLADSDKVGTVVDCRKSLTTVTGARAHKGTICSGQLVFDENFNKLDLNLWRHELTLSGGGGNEFQWYVNDRANSFTRNGKLYVRPTLTSSLFGEDFLSSGTIDLKKCTMAFNDGCYRIGTDKKYLNPVRSARLYTRGQFGFKYGRVEVKAKLPHGDWLFPAIWLQPFQNTYGTWPLSGEIDIVESRGNDRLFMNGKNIGSERASTAIHYGLNSTYAFRKYQTFEKFAEAGKGFNNEYHRYQMIWTPDFITFLLDDHKLGTIKMEPDFWTRGQFEKLLNTTNSPPIKNPWAKGRKNAPFDNEFSFVINLAVGGTSYFPDKAVNENAPKGWKNWRKRAAITDFWNTKDNWLPTWHMNDETATDSMFLIDYVKVWAL